MQVEFLTFGHKSLATEYEGYVNCRVDDAYVPVLEEPAEFAAKYGRILKFWLEYELKCVVEVGRARFISLKFGEDRVDHDGDRNRKLRFRVPSLSLFFLLLIYCLGGEN